MSPRLYTNLSGVNGEKRLLVYHQYLHEMCVNSTTASHRPVGLWECGFIGDGVGLPCVQLCQLWSGQREGLDVRSYALQEHPPQILPQFKCLDASRSRDPVTRVGESGHPACLLLFVQYPEMPPRQWVCFKLFLYQIKDCAPCREQSIARRAVLPMRYRVASRQGFAAAFEMRSTHGASRIQMTA